MDLERDRQGDLTTRDPRGTRLRTARFGGNMNPFSKIKVWLLEKGGKLGYLVLILLIVFGLMNVVHNITYRKPIDGGTWEMEGDQLKVVDTDLDADTSLQIGDVLLGIDDQAITDVDSYQDFMHEVSVGSRHLYILDRSGSRYEPWVEIKGVKDPHISKYYFFAVSGFIYLMFLFLILSQEVTFRARSELLLFCLCVYLTFVFHPTDRFTSLDWISFYLDQLGGLLLPSALTALALRQSLSNNKWLPFIQTVHWLPSVVLALLLLIWIPSILGVSSSNTAERYFEDLQRIQGLWGGCLIVVSVMVLALVAELYRREKNFSLFWAMSWIPFALTLWKLDYPFSTATASLAPIALPLALIFSWSREGHLYLGSIGKKGFVYLFVTLVLILGYFLFIGTFQALLGSQIGPDGLSIISGLGIMFAAVSYMPLRHYVADSVDRMIYGERFESLKELVDFSGINRADTRIEAFLTHIVHRLARAFAIETVAAYLGVDGVKAFRAVDEANPYKALVIDELPEALLAGDLLRGVDVDAFRLQQDKREALVPEAYICPIRVSGSLAALIVFELRDGGRLTPEEYRLLRSMLDQCGVLMENMELYANINQKAQDIMQLKESNENIIESSRLGILTTDEMERAGSCNSAFADLVGRPRDQILGLTFDELFSRLKVTSRQSVKFGVNTEAHFTNERGEDLILEIQKTALKTKENEVYGTLYLVEDIREKKRISLNMMQQEKLASIGLLAAGVAHEINTPLTGITSYSQFLSGDSGLTEEQRELLGLIQAQSQRAAHIVASLLNFSRKESEPKGPVDVAEVLRQTIKFLSHQLQKANVEVTMELPAESPPIEGYANPLQQVFVNLIVNAMDAMPEGGGLWIQMMVRRRVIELIFRDEGVGMDATTRRHIFDPFFTTKEVGKGTGLGMSVVYNIMQEHQGSIEVDSQPGKGATFRLRFPLHAPERLAWPAAVPTVASDESRR
ncbi:PAS domain S-box protein [Sulfidibacter corallicola]|uniref:histidine kinase n=1 Tax=Sulfidibacter corallicola TaxID=2818388 RepID=A0A8A4TXS2_SULCO|nr:ATP-binding protein [Sulfidibacter corallicola]QTD54283.1 PAS domain S-box protein [Sulfidibacter corallicola]